jgi:hypothetical protein
MKQKVMKYVKIVRIFGMVVILSTLIATMPVAVAQTTRFIDPWPTKGKIGDTITLVGEGFNKSTSAKDKYAAIFFSGQKASTYDDIGNEVKAYKLVKEGVWLDENGAFETTFTIPSKLDDGDDEEDVIFGTYYVYVCHYVGNIISPRIRAIAEFTVPVGEITIDPNSGPVATFVEIRGTDFTSGKNIIFKYDGSDVDIERGDDETNSNGEFISYLLIPENAAGIHTITVSISGNDVEAEFTIDPEAILSTTSGEANTIVAVDGTGFSSRNNVVIFFNDVGLATATTDVLGGFRTTFIVPELKAGIYSVVVEDEDEKLDKAKFTIIIPPHTPALTPPPPSAPAPKTTLQPPQPVPAPATPPEQSPVPPPAPPPEPAILPVVNWWLFVGITVAAAIVFGAIVGFLTFRRKA